MKQINLRGGKTALVDDDDYDALAVFDWSAVKARSSNDNWYAKRTEVGPEGRTVNIYMYRQILVLASGEEADHKDRNGLNNQRSNLRKCNRQLNCANIVYDVPASGYRGVYRHRKRWRSDATVEGKTVYLGLFADPVQVACVRDDYVYRLYGEFAILNFPERYGASV